MGLSSLILRYAAPALAAGLRIATWFLDRRW